MAERTFQRTENYSLRDRIRPIAAISAAAFRADPLRASASLALRLTAAAAGPVFAVAVAALVDAARPGQPLAGALVAAGVLAFAIAARAVLDEIGWKIVQILEERTSHHVDLEIIRMVAGLPSVEHLERPEHLDRIERIEDEQWLLAMSVEAVINTAVVAFNIGLTVALLGSVDPILFLLPLVALPSVYAAAKAERLRWRVLDENVADYRRVDDLLKLSTDIAPAKELRVFGLRDELISRAQAVSENMERWERDHQLTGAKWISMARVVFVAGYVGSIGLVAARVASGGASLGDLVLTVVLAGQVMQQLNGASGTANWTAWTFTAVRRWLWLLDYVRESRSFDAPDVPASDADTEAATDAPASMPVSVEPVPAPPSIRDGIRFEGVTFRYPGMDNDVLHDVDLTIPAGTTVALVGDNGAGKSTIVKLLCRFYKPTAGRITVDGADLGSIDVESWREATGAVFQDHARLELNALDAVTIGDLTHFGDTDAAEAALARAGSADVLAALPEGWDTQLGAQWPNGIDLSGGQWQKIALGRGLMRDGALLFVFDEPTASLDADTEHRLFQSYAELAHRGRAETGTITVLVSHRFSTVRMADLIIVVADGRIIESGSHDQLVAQRGIYAELYELQARAYR